MSKSSRIFLRVNAVVTLFLSSHCALAQNTVIQKNSEQFTKKWLVLDEHNTLFMQNLQQEKQQLLIDATHESTILENVQTLQSLVNLGES
jgi:hypothetical protein